MNKLHDHPNPSIETNPQDPEMRSSERAWAIALAGSVLVGSLVGVGAHIYDRENRDDHMPTPDDDRVTITPYNPEESK